jgi:hypothetical protein
MIVTFDPFSGLYHFSTYAHCEVKAWSGPGGHKNVHSSLEISYIADLDYFFLEGLLDFDF